MKGYRDDGSLEATLLAGIFLGVALGLVGRNFIDYLNDKPDQIPGCECIESKKSNIYNTEKINIDALCQNPVVR